MGIGNNEGIARSTSQSAIISGHAKDYNATLQCLNSMGTFKILFQDCWRAHIDGSWLHLSGQGKWTGHSVKDSIHAPSGPPRPPRRSSLNDRPAKLRRTPQVRHKLYRPLWDGGLFATPGEAWATSHRPSRDLALLRFPFNTPHPVCLQTYRSERSSLNPENTRLSQRGKEKIHIGPSYLKSD